MAIVNCIKEMDNECIPDIAEVIKNSDESCIWKQIRFFTQFVIVSVDDKIEEDIWHLGSLK